MSQLEEEELVARLETGSLTVFKLGGRWLDQMSVEDARVVSIADLRKLSATEKKAAAEITRLQAEIKEREDQLRRADEWRNQFDCCMCGSRMEDHDIGSGHSPVSMYEYHMGQLEQRADALEAELKEAREALEPFALLGDVMSPASVGDDSVWVKAPDATPVRNVSGAANFTFGDFRRARAILRRATVAASEPDNKGEPS